MEETIYRTMALVAAFSLVGVGALRLIIDAWRRCQGEDRSDPACWKHTRGRRSSRRRRRVIFEEEYDESVDDE